MSDEKSSSLPPPPFPIENEAGGTPAQKRLPLEEEVQAEAGGLIPATGGGPTPLQPPRAMGGPEPPPYAKDVSTTGDDAMIPPGTVRLADRFIHASDSASDASSPPLYGLSKPIGYLRDTDQTVQLERLDYALKGLGGSAPRVAAKSKLVYYLRRPPPITGPAFPYVAESASRTTLGSVGFRTFRSGFGFGTGGGGGWRAWRVVKKKVEKKGVLDFVEEGEAIFEVKRRKVGGWRDRGGSGSGSGIGIGGPTSSSSSPTSSSSLGEVFEWFDHKGTLIAVEDEGEVQGMHRLVVLVALDRRTRDALVAMWCLRLWGVMAERNRFGR